MAYRIEFLPDAEKDFDTLDGLIRKEVAKEIDALADNPFLGKPLGKKYGPDLTGFYKLYVEKKKYRIVYRLIGKYIEVIEIVGIGKRDKGEVYKLVAKGSSLNIQQVSFPSKKQGPLFRSPTSLRLRVHSHFDRHFLIRRPFDPGSPVETNMVKPKHIFQGKIEMACFPSSPRIDDDLFVLGHSRFCKEFLQILLFLPNPNLFPF
jgi:mRNA interferase RelE/StbE